MTGFLCFVLGASAANVLALAVARRDDRRRAAQRPIANRYANQRVFH